MNGLLAALLTYRPEDSLACLLTGLLSLSLHGITVTV